MGKLSRWLGLAVIHLFPKRRIAGFTVVFTDTAVDRSRCLAHLEAAASTVVAVPGAYSSLIRRIRYIVVWPGNRTFADTKGGVHIESSVLLGVSELALASVLVHEAVHLRVSALGIKYDQPQRERIERLCIRTQAHFLRSSGLPRGDEMAREAEEALASPWWTREERAQRNDQLLTDHGLPRWLRTIMPNN